MNGMTTKVRSKPERRRFPSFYRIYMTLGITVLTWISIYWFSRAGPAASVRIYYETRRSGERLNPPRTKVPLGISYFPQELALGPNT